MFEGCPGSKTADFREKDTRGETPSAKVQSQLRQWPIQMHLISPTAPNFQGADVVLAARHHRIFKNSQTPKDPC